MSKACVRGTEAAARQPRRPLTVGHHSMCRDKKCATDSSVFLDD